MKSLIAALVVAVLSNWSASAQDRGLSAVATDCDRLAASPFDNERPPGVPGVMADKVDAKVAIPACEAALKAAPNDQRVMFQLGRAYNAGGNYEAAFKQYSDPRAKGNLNATVNLGTLYLNGRGVAKDEAEGVRLYRLASDRGNPFGQFDVGSG